ncbi:hypothetical protein TNCV_2088551 [Trichonephila clavipes]|nr:hypothetical protein TNCV_2088551 [Trichonephila clavipes]
MPRKRKSNLSQISYKARAMKVARLNETFPQPKCEGLNRRSMRQLTELLRHQSSSKLNVNRMLNISHLNGLLRHPHSPKFGVFSRRLTWRLKRDTETVEAAESHRRAVAERAQQRRLIFTK